MLLLLKPPPQSGFTDIEITRRLFAVGRREPPFTDYPKESAAKLSRRHARVFIEGSTAYVADLESLNGTSVNGTPVKSAPVALNDGDTVAFGGLKYTVQWVAPARDEALATAGQLVLKPTAAETQLEAAVIAQFPMLINKHSELFAGFTDSEALSYLSRNHAQILRLGDEFHIEDLGSTNGTFVNGRNIEEHVRQLSEGDVIRFGGEVLSYQVYFHEFTPTPADDDETVLEITRTDDAAAPEVSAVLDSSRTIFVDSATSFLEVYFNDGGDKADNVSEQEQPEPAPASTRNSVPAAIAGTFFSNSKTLRRAVVGLAALVLIGLGLFGYRYWSGDGLREVEALTEAGEFQQSLVLSNRLLASRPNDARLQTLATNAALELVLAPWSAAHDLASVEDMSTLVQQARAQGEHNEADDSLLELLDWAGTVRGFLDQRRSDEDPFELARRVSDLLEFWTENQNQRTRDLRTLLDAEPTFEKAHTRIFADVRRLRSLDLDGERMRELRAALDTVLPSGDSAAVRELVQGLIDSDPDQPGMELVQAELESYAALQQLLLAEQWVQASERLRDTGFQTVPFRQYAEKLQREQLPDTAFLSAYRQALGLWRAGQFDRSEQALLGLASERWGDVAERRLQVQQQRLARWRELQQQREETGYPRALFDFYASLDHTEDLGLIDQLRPDFMLHSKDALREATRTLARAEQAWRQYRSAGGVQTEHRLRADIGSAYMDLAALLSASYGDFNRGMQIYGQLGVAPSQNWLDVQEQLRREIAVQRSALSNLQVLAPSVRAGKLALLPRLDDEQP